MKKTISISWMKNMAFEADIEGHKITMDASTKVGGENKGPTPKPLLMASLGGCTAMDVISLARKMRQDVESFDIEMEADLTETHPMHYTHIKLIYKFKGTNLDPEKLKKAVTLSQDKYCGVSETLRKTVDISYEIVIL
ncbi:MAG: OsmC family protein [Bacteroidetes bacterium]|jgi:putative redox protein|nr:OsmC family protein [Bacteroidota bacterium]MBT3750923.1 OsmC family protein [Bacteroidota bacterium]MBT4400317.1 OsmC family protein [Bacteroidota bacterium]MBT4408689.1 OsmC family protein [Bacteroidota bacterium]MBT7462729.1 OsmC family protein [Bacteroidota bacterium]